MLSDLIWVYDQSYPPFNGGDCLLSVEGKAISKKILDSECLFIGCFDNCEDVILPIESRNTGSWTALIKRGSIKKILTLWVESGQQMTIPSKEVPESSEVCIFLFSTKGLHITIGINECEKPKTYGGFKIKREQKVNLNCSFDLEQIYS